MTKKLITIALAILMITAVTATAVFFMFPYEPKDPPRADESNSTAQGITNVIEANNQFAFDLYKQLEKKETGNIFYSPYSLSAALAMTQEGAKGKTLEEIKKVFYFPENEVLRSNYAAIYNKLNEKNKEYELRTGNALWVQQDFSLDNVYTENVEKFYGGKVANVDFMRETEKSRQTINNFIQEQTNDRIKNLIASGIINPMATKLILTNAVYFKGTWENEFEKANTVDQDFFVNKNEVVKTKMMHMNPKGKKYNYTETDDLQILEMPYKGQDLSMLILLPKENLSAIESSLTLNKIKEYRSSLNKTSIDSISLPSFEFDSKYSLEDTLSLLGMPTAFSDNANFSGITNAGKLKIGNVIHQAFVKVDETGTEAAAATAVIMNVAMAMPPENPTVFRADHPFIFLIQDKEGNILFLGRLSNPTLGN